MQILINSKTEITAWCTVGSFDGGIDCTIPDSVLSDNPLSYKYIDGEFVKNPDYKPPEPPEPPLSEVELLKAQNKALSDRLEFTEDLIAEMAMKVYAE